MKYKENIIAAIYELKDRSGSSLIAIKKALKSKYPDKEWRNSQFMKTIKAGIADGEFVKVKNSIKLTPEFKMKIIALSKQPEKKKGRPASSKKSDEPVKKVSTGKRGRPRKDAETVTSTTSTKIPGRKPGRPRKVDTDKDPEVGTSTTSTKIPGRKPGRPRKVDTDGDPIIARRPVRPRGRPRKVVDSTGTIGVSEVDLPTTVTQHDDHNTLGISTYLVNPNASTTSNNSIPDMSTTKNQQGKKVAEDDVVVAKKKRGRPKLDPSMKKAKKPVLQSVVGMDPKLSTSTIKKGRGRPRKTVDPNIVIQQNADIDAGAISHNTMMMDPGESSEIMTEGESANMMTYGGSEEGGLFPEVMVEGEGVDSSFIAGGFDNVGPSVDADASTTFVAVEIPTSLTTTEMLRAENDWI